MYLKCAAYTKLSKQYPLQQLLNLKRPYHVCYYFIAGYPSLSQTFLWATHCRYTNSHMADCSVNLICGAWLRLMWLNVVYRSVCLFWTFFHPEQNLLHLSITWRPGLVFQLDLNGLHCVNEYMWFQISVTPPLPSFPLPSRGERACPGVALAQFQLITAWVMTAWALLLLASDRQLVLTSNPHPAAQGHHHQLYLSGTEASLYIRGESYWSLVFP